MISHPHSQQPAPRRRLGVTLALSIMVVAGLARVLAVTLDDYQHTGTSHSVTEDAVTTRRSLQMVAIGVQALLVANGRVAIAETSDEQMEAGAGLEVAA
ncbi:MAG: hypothetical protein AAFN78_08635 [Pseudomonadota bacterium]